MTYCVATKLDAGMIFASDSRTNAGVDHINRFCKLRIFEKVGDRVIVILSSGNLSITQNAINLLEQVSLRQSNKGEFKSDSTESFVSSPLLSPEYGCQSLFTATSLFDVASLLGNCLREVRRRDGPFMVQSNVDSSASFLIGGQIGNERMRLFNVYTEGNFIETSSDTPYFQIGETKYGKPIIDRVINTQTTLIDAAKCVLVSFDSTMRSNISVGLPIDLMVYEAGSLKVGIKRRIEEGDPYFTSIHTKWGDGLKTLFTQLPNPNWKM